MNGVSFLASNQIGPGILQTEVLAGEGTLTVPSVNPFASTTTNTTTQLKYALALDVRYELNHRFTTRLGYVQADVKGQSDVRTPNPLAPTTAIIAPTPLDFGRGRFMSAGVKYDSDTYFGSAEFVKRLLQGGAYHEVSAYYLMGGYNIGKWSPYYTYSKAFGLGGTAIVYPDTTVATTVIEKQSYTHNLGLNYHCNDSVVLKGSYARTHQDYTDATKSLEFDVYQAAVVFVF